MTSILKGMATITFFSSDMNGAKQWYTDFLGVAPYFEVPAGPNEIGYVEFRLGDYQHEFGIINSKFHPNGAHIPASGAVLYWHVDDVSATFNQLLTLGAIEHEPIIQRQGGEFITASVIDPFGNILGIMQNPHYLEILAQIK